MLTGVVTDLRKREKAHPQKAHQRRVIRVSETLTESRSSGDARQERSGRRYAPTGAVAKRLGLGSYLHEKGPIS